MNKLLTIEEVAVILGKSKRTVRRLPNLVFYRVGGSRRYDERDVKTYLAEQAECQSSCAKAARTITRSSKSKALGFFEALAAAPNAKPAPQKSA
jgi:excisionase family DNA binding protein